MDELEETLMSNETLKPRYLYHASPNRDIDIFEPRAESVRNREEGPRVFAAESPAEVSVFLVDSNDSWSQKSSWRDEEGNKIIVAIYGDKKRFLKNDKGGSIYTLPSNSFAIDEEFSGSSKEWTSKEPVKHLEKTDYESGLEAMLDAGVQVYFVSIEVLKDIQEAEDHGYSILQSLKSENEASDRNFTPLN